MEAATAAMDADIEAADEEEQAERATVGEPEMEVDDRQSEAEPEPDE